MATWKVPTDQGEVRVEAATAQEAAQKAAAGDILGFVEGSGPQPEMSKAASAGMGVSQGATFGFGDEMFGALAEQGAAQARGPLAERGINIGSEGETYNYARDEARRAAELAQQANPGSYFAGELAGGVAIPGTSTFGVAKTLGGMRGADPLARMVSQLRPTSRLALSGAGAGAVAGAGYSDAETTAGMLGDTALGAGVGLVAAPLTGAALRIGSGMYQGGKNILRDAIFGDDAAYAEKRVRGLLENEGITTPGQARSEVDRLVGSEQGRLGDVLPYEAESLAQSPGAGGKIVRDFTEERQAGQQDRLKAAAGEELQPIWDDYNRFLRDIDVQKRAQAQPLYDEADRVGFTMTDNLARLFEKPSVKKALKKAYTTVLDELDSPLRSAQAPTDATMSLGMVDETLKVLGDQIQSSLVKKPARARQLIRLKKAIEAEIYEQNPAYQQARGVWAGAKQLERAAEEGRDLLKGSRLYDIDIRQRMTDMTDAERDALRVGLVRGIADRVESASSTGNAVNRLANSTRVRDLLREAFGNEEAAQRFLQTIDNETVMNMMYGLTRTGGGSRTARTLAQRNKNTGMDIDSMTGYGAAAGDVRMMGVGMVRAILKKLGAGDDMTEAQGEEVARLLFGAMDDETLNRVFRRRAARAVQEMELDEQVPAIAGGSVSSLLTGEAVE